jgi:hypothetical protein
VLQVGLDTVNRDISYVRNQAKTNIKKYIDERLPEEYALVHASACVCISHHLPFAMFQKGRQSIIVR